MQKRDTLFQDRKEKLYPKTEELQNRDTHFQLITAIVCPENRKCKKRDTLLLGRKENPCPKIGKMQNRDKHLRLNTAMVCPKNRKYKKRIRFRKIRNTMPENEEQDYQDYFDDNAILRPSINYREGAPFLSGTLRTSAMISAPMMRMRQVYFSQKNKPRKPVREPK